MKRPSVPPGPQTRHEYARLAEQMMRQGMTEAEVAARLRLTRTGVRELLRGVP